MTTRRVLAVLTLLALCAPAASAGRFARHAGHAECSPEQRDQFRTTEELVTRLWLHGRRAYQSVRKEGADQAKVQGYHDALKADFSEAWRSHERFVSLLDDAQRDHFSTRINSAERVRRHCLTRFDQLAELIAEGAINERQSAERLEEIADECRDWLRQLHRIDWHVSNL